MREWIDWLTRVRLLMIALILSVGVAWPSYLPATSGSRYFLPLVIFWITLGASHIILVRWLPNAGWHGFVQVASDVVMTSALVYATGLQESYFISLYLLVIIVASILFSRNAAFLTAAVCVALLGGLTLLAYEAKIPRTYVGSPTAEVLRLWFLSNLVGFLAVAYLAGLLAQSLRSKGRELEEKREELGFHRRHHPFHARGINHYGHGRASRAAQSNRRGNLGAPVRRHPRAQAGRSQRGILERRLSGHKRGPVSTA